MGLMSNGQAERPRKSERTLLFPKMSFGKAEVGVFGLFYCYFLFECFSLSHAGGGLIALKVIIVSHY